MESFWSTPTGKGLLFVATVNLATFVSFWLDKRLALAGRSRLPEAHLIFLSLCGGWPSGIMAMKRLHHKTQKSSFRLKFFFVAATHSALVLWWLVDPSSIGNGIKNAMKYVGVEL